MLFPWSTVYGLSQYQDSWEARCAASQCSCSCRLDWDGKHLDYYFSELMGSSSEQRCTCTFLSWFWGRRRKVKVMEGEEGKAGIPTKKKKKVNAAFSVVKSLTSKNLISLVISFGYSHFSLQASGQVPKLTIPSLNVLVWGTLLLELIPMRSLGQCVPSEPHRSPGWQTAR